MAARRLFLFVLIIIQGLLPTAAYAQIAPPVTKPFSVRARVPSTPSDFQLQFNADRGNVAQDDTTTYTITYGSLLGNDTSVALTASWDRGRRVESDNNGFVDIASYVNGSATKAYGQTPPVVDLINRKITWNISSFPGDTIGQTVSFKLRMANFTEKVPVRLNVKADMTADETNMPQRGVSQTYEFDPTRLSPTPTPTPAPITPTLTPQGRIRQLSSSVTIQSISSTQATITIATTNPSTQIIQYGLSPSQLTETIRSLTPAYYQEIQFPNLLPNTQYYFQINSKDTFGNTVPSDIFTFKTAATSQVSTIQLPSIVITSDNKVMTTRFDTGEKETGLPPFILLPRNSTYEIQFSFDAKTPIKTTQILTRDKQVLSGLNDLFAHKTFAANESTDMVEIRPGVFVAKILAPLQVGVYEVFARIADYNGNISEQKIASLHVSHPFTVTDTKDIPIEKARILLYVLRQSTNSYERIGNHSITNPSFTNYIGESDMVLPPGNYKAHVTALGYLPQDITFTIGESNTKGYPIIKLSSDNYTLWNFFSYTQDTASDISNGFIKSMQDLTASSRVFDFISLVLLLMFVIVTFLAFTMKTHTHPKTGISQLSFMLHHLFDKNTKKHYVLGVVIDKKTHQPLSHAKVFILDDNTKNVLHETYTNKKGSFLLKKPFKHYHMMAVKNGFEPAVVYPTTTDLLYITLHANTPQNIIKNEFVHTSHRVFSMLFETLLAFCIVLEVFFIQVFGIEKVWPFLILSVANMLLWFYYLSLKHYKHI